MTVTVTAFTGTNPGGSTTGFRSPLLATIALAACLVLHAVDEALAEPAEPQPGPSPEPAPEPIDHGFAPGEVATISGALRSSGLYERIGNDDAFLGNVLQAIQDHPEPEGGTPSEADARAILSAALVGYSDADGDGAADLPAITDEEVAAFYAAVRPMFDAPAPPAPAS